MDPSFAADDPSPRGEDLIVGTVQDASQQQPQQVALIGAVVENLKAWVPSSWGVGLTGSWTSATLQIDSAGLVTLEHTSVDEKEHFYDLDDAGCAVYTGVFTAWQPSETMFELHVVGHSLVLDADSPRQQKRIMGYVDSIIAVRRQRRDRAGAGASCSASASGITTTGAADSGSTGGSSKAPARPPPKVPERPDKKKQTPATTAEMLLQQVSVVLPKSLSGYLRSYTNTNTNPPPPLPTKPAFLRRHAPPLEVENSSQLWVAIRRLRQDLPHIPSHLSQLLQAIRTGLTLRPLQLRLRQLQGRQTRPSALDLDKGHDPASPKETTTAAPTPATK